MDGDVSEQAAVVLLRSRFVASHHVDRSRLIVGFGQYGDVELYNQLRFFSFLFDAEKALKASQGRTSSGV